MIKFFKDKKGSLLIIIASLCVILFSAFSIAQNIIGGIFGPEKTIYVKFKDLAPVSENIPVYYNGIKVGKVTKIEISDDYKHTLLTVHINKKNFNPPKNIYGEIRIEGRPQVRAKGFYVGKYMSLEYPEKPSEETLKNGDVIEGRPTYIETFQDVFKGQVKEKDIKSAIDSTRETAANAREVSEKLSAITDKIDKFLARNEKKFDQIVSDTQITTNNWQYASSVIREFAQQPAEKKGLRSVLYDFADTAKNTKNITSGIDTITGNSCLQKSIIDTTSQTATFMSGLNTTRCKFDQSIDNFNVAVCDADRAINRYDCMGSSLSEMLSQRFLILKLFFGKPGSSFSNCTGSCTNNPATK